MSTERLYIDYLKDIVDALVKIKEFSNNLTYKQFCADNKTIFAVV